MRALRIETTAVAADDFDLKMLAKRWCQGKFSAVPPVLASAHEQSVPIFQQLARGHPSGRDDDVRYPLSLRNVEDLLAERGIDISHETVRFWWNRFGSALSDETLTVSGPC